MLPSILYDALIDFFFIIGASGVSWVNSWEFEKKKTFVLV